MSITQIQTDMLKGITKEQFLLLIIDYLDYMDSWALDQAPIWVKKLEDDYGYTRPERDKVVDGQENG